MGMKGDSGPPVRTKCIITYIDCKEMVYFYLTG